MAEVSLLKVSLDGEVVAEAQLKVYDQTAAWHVFIQCFPAIAHLVAGELFGTMTAACDDEVLARTPQTGLILELSTRPKPQIVLPNMANGHLPTGRQV